MFGKDSSHFKAEERGILETCPGQKVSDCLNQDSLKCSEAVGTLFPHWPPSHVFSPFFATEEVQPLLEYVDCVHRFQNNGQTPALDSALAQKSKGRNQAKSEGLKTDDNF